MQSLPEDLLQLILLSVGDGAVVKYASTSRKSQQIVNSVEKSNAYWKARAARKLDFPLVDTDTDVDWKSFYKLSQTGMKYLAIGKYFSLDMILRWCEYIKAKGRPDIIGCVLDGVIDSDRVDIYDKLIEVEATALRVLILVTKILRSNGGWNLLVREISTIQNMAKEGFPLIDWFYLVNAAVKSTDIAHYMLLNAIQPIELSDAKIQVLAKIIIKYNPTNLGYYLQNSQFLRQFVITLKELQRNYWHYSEDGSSPDFLDFIRLALKYSSDIELRKMLKSPLVSFDLHQSDLLKVLLEDPRVTSELIRKTLLIKFCTTEERNVKEFELLNGVLKYEVSEYIQAGIVDVADSELSNYMIRIIAKTDTKLYKSLENQV